MNVKSASRIVPFPYAGMTQFRFQGVISVRLPPDTPNGDGSTVCHDLWVRQAIRIDRCRGRRLYSRFLRIRKILSTEMDDGGVAKW